MFEASKVSAVELTFNRSFSSCPAVSSDGDSSDTFDANPNVSLAHVNYNTAAVLLHQTVAFPEPHWADKVVVLSSVSAGKCIIAAETTAAIASELVRRTDHEGPIASQLAHCVFVNARFLLRNISPRLPLNSASRRRPMADRLPFGSTFSVLQHGAEPLLLGFGPDSCGDDSPLGWAGLSGEGKPLSCNKIHKSAYPNLPRGQVRPFFSHQCCWSVCRELQL